MQNQRTVGNELHDVIRDTDHNTFSSSVIIFVGFHGSTALSSLPNFINNSSMCSPGKHGHGKKAAECVSDVADSTTRLCMSDLPVACRRANRGGIVTDTQASRPP